MNAKQAQQRWLNSPMARALFATECALLKRTLPKFQGHFCLHLLPWSIESIYRPLQLKHHVIALESLQGIYTGEDLDESQGPSGLDPSEASDSLVSNEPARASSVLNSNLLVTDFSAWPLRDNSIDVIFLHHCLEFHPAPHSILREVSRVLLPNGALVAVVFNPYSCWGIRRLLCGWSQSEPLKWRPITQGRVEDWMRLLDYRIELQTRCMYRWPTQWKKALEWLAPLEGLSRLPWMLGGGVHVTMARKQVGGLTPLRPRWRPPNPTRPFMPSASRLPKMFLRTHDSQPSKHKRVS